MSNLLQLPIKKPTKRNKIDFLMAIILLSSILGSLLFVIFCLGKK